MVAEAAVDAAIDAIASTVKSPKINAQHTARTVTGYPTGGEKRAGRFLPLIAGAQGTSPIANLRTPGKKLGPLHPMPPGELRRAAQQFLLDGEGNRLRARAYLRRADLAEKLLSRLAQLEGLGVQLGRPLGVAHCINHLTGQTGPNLLCCLLCHGSTSLALADLHRLHVNDVSRVPAPHRPQRPLRSIARLARARQPDSTLHSGPTLVNIALASLLSKLWKFGRQPMILPREAFLSKAKTWKTADFRAPAQ
jgi:hypothetical protein